MKQQTQDRIIYQLDAIIATIGQAVVLDKLTAKEKQARELLKDARLLIVEEMEGASEREEVEESSDEDVLAEERQISEQKIISILKNLEGHFAERARVNAKAAVLAVTSDPDDVDYASLATSCTIAARWEAKRDAVLSIAERLGLSLEESNSESL